MGTVKLLLTFAVLVSTSMGQQINNDFIPASSGLNLGHSNQRWNMFVQNLDVAGSCTVASSCLSAGLLSANNTWTGTNTYNGPIIFNNSATFNSSTAFASGATLTGALSSSGGSLSGTFGGTPTFSGGITFSAAPTLAAGAAMSGTFTGNHSYSGNVNFTGATTINSNNIAQVVYSTPSASTNASIVPGVTMAAAGGSGNTYRYTVYVSQSALGSGCSTNSTVALDVLWTDPNASGALTFQLTLQAGNGATEAQATIVNNGSLGGSGTSGTLTFRAKTGTVVQYETIFFSGTCTTAPSYQIYPVLELLN